MALTITSSHFSVMAPSAYINSTRSEPATNDCGPVYAGQAFAALYQANAHRIPLRLIFGIQAGSVGQFIASPNILQSLVESQLYANYPDCALDHLPADA